MNSYSLIPQEKDNFCVCSVLQTILIKHGLNLSQKEISLNLTSLDDGFSYYDSRIKEFMEENSFHYEYFGPKETPFNEPDELLKEMEKYDGIIGINSHTYLLKRFRYPELELINPKDGQIIKKRMDEVLGEMTKSNGGFGLIKYVG